MYLSGNNPFCLAVSPCKRPHRLCSKHINCRFYSVYQPIALYILYGIIVLENKARVLHRSPMRRARKACSRSGQKEVHDVNHGSCLLRQIHRLTPRPRMGTRRALRILRGFPLGAHGFEEGRPVPEDRCTDAFYPLNRLGLNHLGRFSPVLFESSGTHQQRRFLLIIYAREQPSRYHQKQKMPADFCCEICRHLFIFCHRSWRHIR